MSKTQSPGGRAASLWTPIHALTVLAEADALLNQILDNPYNRTVLPFAYFWKGEIGYRNKQLDTAIKYFHAYMDAGECKI